MTASNNFLVRVVVIIACLSVGLGRPGPAATQPLAAETKSAPVTLREATAHAIARLQTACTISDWDGAYPWQTTPCVMDTIVADGTLTSVNGH